MSVLRGIHAVVVVCFLLATGCVGSRTESCGGDLVCGDGTSCVAIPQFDAHACVTRAQIDACAGIDDGKACMLDATPGTCFSGACHPATCGDKIVDLTEVCDDANRVSGDGCSSTCTSFEKCGDGLIDLALGEQCDDGLGGLSGDGCSSTCKSEFVLWRSVVPAAPTTRTGYGTASGLDGSVVIYGGSPFTSSGTGGPATLYGDLWTFDGFAWLPSIAVGEPPPVRSSFAFARDPLRNRLILYGGVAADGSYLGDVWEFDGLRWVNRTPASGAGPGARKDVSLACTMTRCVLFGGVTSSSAEQKDLWAWDGTSWTSINAANPPSARHAAVLIGDPMRDTFQLVGGRSGASFETDAFELAGSGWTLKSPSNSMFPGGALAGAYDPVSQQPVIVGPSLTYNYNGFSWSITIAAPPGIVGVAYSALARRTIAINSAPAAYALESMAWMARPVVVPNAGTSSGTARTAVAYDVRRARTIAFDATGTWEWNGIGWRYLTSSGPVAGDGGAMAYDTACHTAIEYGGRNGVLFSQVWTIDGTSWIQRANAPTARAFHAMAFDQERRALVVFGGTVNGASDPATWLWSGSCDARTWTSVTPSPSPPVRTSAVLVYDEKRKVSVLFGGSSSTTELGDTWEWNGATWTKRLPLTSPPPRTDHMMAYDERRGHVVLFGGRAGQVRLDDTWEWDGDANTWREVPIILAPSRRVGGAMARDATGDLIVVGGELRPGEPATDVLRLRYERGVGTAERCRAADDDFDVDGLKGCDDPDCWTRCRPWCAPGTSCTASHCGDAVCDATEDYLLCPTDCPVPP